MEEINRQKREYIIFLSWLIQRLIYKHSYDKKNSIISSIEKLIDFLQPKQFCINIDQKNLDKIISKYYVDFNFDGSDDINFGFTETQRNRLREDIRNLINDVINENIPEDTFKG